MTQTKRDSRERARKAIEAQRQAEARRKNMRIAAGAVAGVVAVILILVGLALSQKSSKPKPATPAAQALVNQVTGVPAATLDTIGKGKITTPLTAKSGVPVLTADGKPLVFYFGAEFCPFCAAERWPMIVALSRFGTFSNLSQISSSEENIPTFTFEGSTYTSKYVTFQPREVEDQNRNQLDKLTAAQQQLVNTYDPPAAPGEGNSFPFATIANQYLINGASYDNSILVGKSQAQVAAALQDPSTPIAQAIGGTANSITAAICKTTNNQPADVCTSAAVRAFNG